MVVSFLFAVVVVGCGSGLGNIDERDGEESGAVINEEDTAPKGDRSAAGTAQELVGFDEEVASPSGQGSLPRDFGEGSLWATDDPLLKRVDPQTVEVVEEIPLGGCVSGDFGPQAAVGAESVWVSSSYVSYGSERSPRTPCDVVLKVDPQTKRVVDQIPVDPPTDLDFGHGSVWVISESYGTLSRIDPQTGEVVANIDVQSAPLDIAVDESSGAVWVAGRSMDYDKPEDNKLSRVDPATNRVVAEIPIRAGVRICKYDDPGCLGGGAYAVAVGEGAVWVSSDDKLVKVDPETNKVAGMVSVGANYSQLVVYGVKEPMSTGSCG